MPKAYSYLRFSTSEQEKGDSTRRQRAAVREYLRKHPDLELDTALTFDDRGVSALRGKNAEVGALARFLEMVRSGEIAEGSYLLLEGLDRMSRQVPRRAARVLEDIVDEGIVVVTLSSRSGVREYTAESLNEVYVFLEVVLEFSRANQESEWKSHRLKEAWDGKRAEATTKRLTSRGPAWLRATEDGGWEVNEERAEVVRRIFRETLDGSGQHRIAQTLNREGVPTIGGNGRQWRGPDICQLLRNPAVTGVYIPSISVWEPGKRAQNARRLIRRRVKLDTKVEGYYPAVVSAEDFQRVQDMRLDTASPLRGKHSASGEVRNLFAGLLKCSRCGGSVTRVWKGKRSYLVCSAARTGGGCQYQAVRYDQIEDAFVRMAPKLIVDAPTGTAAESLDRELVAKEAALDGLDDMLENLLNAQQHSRSHALAGRIREIELEREQVRRERDDLLDRQAAVMGPLLLKKLADLLDSLQAESLNHSLSNALLRQVFSKVTVDFDNDTLLTVWKHGGESAVPYSGKAYGFTPVETSKKKAKRQSAPTAEAKRKKRA